jgi:hypothetical protein
MELQALVARATNVERTTLQNGGRQSSDGHCLQGSGDATGTDSSATNTAAMLSAML